MGGHGGLNILPQKKWNVYNFDNREKVRLDEEAAAKEEQLKREQSRKRDSELRLEKLRQARGLATVASAVDPNKPSPSSPSSISPIQTLTPSEEKAPEPEKREADSRHINLFEGIRIFDPVKVGEEGRREEKKGKFWRESKKVKKDEVRAVGPEDEKYRVGYGVAGKGVKLPWYMEKRAKSRDSDSEDSDDCCDYDDVKSNKKRKAGGKKSLEELREERLKREKAEKERERALVMGKSKRGGGFSERRDTGFSSGYMPSGFMARRR